MQGQAAVLDPLRERVQLILEEAFKPAEYAFLPSEAARAAEEELHSHFRDVEQSAEQPYLERLHQVLALLWPSSPQYLPGLLEFTMKGERLLCQRIWRPGWTLQLDSTSVSLACCFKSLNKAHTDCCIQDPLLTGMTTLQCKWSLEGIIDGNVWNLKCFLIHSCFPRS